MNTFLLSSDEAAYISQLMSSDESFASLLRNHPDIRFHASTFTLNNSDAELLRDYFTERLAKVGFDAEYKPNKEGTMLELLIDKFYRPNR